MDYLQLINENILYLANTLHYCEKLCIENKIVDLNSLQKSNSLYEICFKKINYSIKICLHCNRDTNNNEINENQANNLIKFEIFYYMTAKYFNASTFSIQSPICCFQLIVDLMIENEFYDTLKVI